jgi:hypothetical protein
MAVLWLRRLVAPLTAENRVRARVNPSGISDGQSGNGTDFPRVLQFSPVIIIQPSPSKLVSSEGCTVCPLVVAVQ